MGPRGFLCDFLNAYRGFGDKGCAIGSIVAGGGGSNVGDNRNVIESICLPVLNSGVTKVGGIATGDTTGMVSEVAADVEVLYPDGRLVTLLDQFVIISKNAFARAGDSGALVMTGRQAVGMVVAGIGFGLRDTIADSRHLCYATEIQRVLRHFGAEFI